MSVSVGEPAADRAIGGVVQEGGGGMAGDKANYVSLRTAPKRTRRALRIYLKEKGFDSKAKVTYDELVDFLMERGGWKVAFDAAYVIAETDSLFRAYFKHRTLDPKTQFTVPGELLITRIARFKALVEILRAHGIDGDLEDLDDDLTEAQGGESG